MSSIARMDRLGGIFLAIGGVGFLISGILHPQGARDEGFREGVASMLESSTWPVAHWLGLGVMLFLVWTIWLLVDAGWTGESLVGRAGARLTIVGGLFMAVQFAAEIGVHDELDAYAAGQSAPLMDLLEPMQAVGWPTFALGFVLLAVGLMSAAPRWIALIGIIGAVAMGLGGLLTMGFHLAGAGPLFLGGVALSLWMIWAGVRLVRGLPAASTVSQSLARPEAIAGS